MTIEEKRKLVSDVYSRPGWKERVANMNEIMINLTYRALTQSGSIKQKGEKKEKKKWLKK